MSKEIDEMFDNEFGDLLSNAKVVPEASTPTPAPTPVEVKPEAPKATAKTTVDGDNYVAFGTKVSTVPIPRFKASKDMKARIAILSKQVLCLKTHYIPGIGSIVCLEDKCCELEGMPKIRYVIPIVVYTTNKNGAVVSEDIELKALVLGVEQYEALADAINFSGRDVQDVDIVCTCSDEQYQKLTFAADASKGAQWKTFSSAHSLVEKYKADKSKLYLAVARKISLETYLTKKGFVSGPATTVGEITNINDMLDE